MPMGSFRFVRYFTVFLSLLLPAAWAQGQGAASGTAKRVALVIGNGKYPTAPLKNPVNDARAIPVLSGRPSPTVRSWSSTKGRRSR